MRISVLIYSACEALEKLQRSSAFTTIYITQQANELHRKSKKNVPVILTKSN